MKNEGAVTSEVIWTSPAELSHLTQEEYLPLMCTNQVSSILSNLEEPEKVLYSGTETPQNMGMIVLENQTSADMQITNSFLNFKENVEGTAVVNGIEKKDATEKKKSKVKIEESLEDILYFVCNLCPFLCIKDTKITEHIEVAHKNKKSVKLLQLKCPVCPNIFYHKISLRSHLIHDHQVGSADLNKIIKAIFYYTKKNINSNNKSPEIAKDTSPTLLTASNNNINCKTEVDLKYVEKLTHSEKILSNDDGFSNESSNNTDLQNMNENILPNSVKSVNFEIEAETAKSCEGTQEMQLLEVISLPTLDITQKNAEKMFSNIMKHQNSVTKYLDQKKLQKCIVPSCKIRLQDASKMNYHIKCHMENNFKCMECSEVFSFWKPMTGHLWRMHKIDMELYSCDKCDYKTFSLGKLNSIHKLIHSEVRAFVCDVCKKAFKNTKQLRNHKITHKEKSEKLVHICELCSKPFADKRQLRVHMDGVHNKIRPFLCNYCGYKGSSQAALRMHTRQHTGEKPFACDTCCYTTADHNSLRRHKLRHTGIKPYKCAHCDYACIQSSTYKAHLKTKHPGLEKDLMYTCHECQFKTVNKDMYLSHLCSVHNQKNYALNS